MSKFRGPLQYSVSDADQFRTVLNEVNYNKSGIADLLTGAAVGNVKLSESLCVSKDHSPLQTLLRLFLLHKNIELGLFQQAVSPMDLSQWIRMGLVRVEQGCVRPLVSIVPCADLLLVCDHHAQDCDPGGCAQSCPEGQCEPGDFVMGYGYDDSLLAENRHPNRDDLDRASTEHPIVLLHVSGHLATTNSAALERVGFNETTDDPYGGVIRRRSGSSEPNGVLEEVAAHMALTPLIEKASQASPQEFVETVRGTADYFAGFGVTTVQDGASTLQTADALRGVASAAPLGIDVAVFPFVGQFAFKKKK